MRVGTLLDVAEPVVVASGLEEEDAGLLRPDDDRLPWRSLILRFLFVDAWRGCTGGGSTWGADTPRTNTVVDCFRVVGHGAASCCDESFGHELVAAILERAPCCTPDSEPESERSESESSLSEETQTRSGISSSSDSYGGGTSLFLAALVRSDIEAGKSRWISCIDVAVPRGGTAEDVLAV